MIAWWVYAVFGALIWGIHYNLIAKATSVASSLTVYTLPNAVILLSLPFWYKVLISDIQAIMAAPLDVRLSTLFLMFTSILGSVAVYKAISMSNATLASLIEITYPIFVTIFAIFMFQENHLTLPVIFGGLLIMSGTGVIIYFHG